VIFVDTSFFIGLFNRRDRDHERVREVFQSVSKKSLGELVTTDHVVFETITFFRSKLSHEAAVFVGERLYSETVARIHETNLDDEKAAFDFLKRHPDKKYSAVDCLSFVTMERLGINEALAVDDDFTHRFTARPGPRPK
jgi:predicted nucleic acid-binding protein